MNETLTSVTNAIQSGQPWNLDGIKDNAPLFILDGPTEAWELKEAGYNAAAVNGQGNLHGILKALKNRPGVIIDALPDTWTEQSQALKAIGSGYIQGEPIPDNDPMNTRTAAEQAREILDRIKSRFTANTAEQALLSLQAEQERYKTPAPKTFSKALDEIMGGGIFPGLYIFGGEPGAGKTAFVMQMADSLAISGTPVFVYALDTGKTDIVARSISRIAYQAGKRIRYRDIMDLYQAKGERFAEIFEAVTEYPETVKSLYIFDGGPGFTAKNISEDVRRWTKLHGKPPVVVVDYLQVLGPIMDKGTERQNADETVKELNSLATDCRATVLAISSWNRSSYGSGGGMQSLKESGTIEYTAIQTISLQATRLLEPPQGTDGKKKTPEEIKAELAAEALKGLPKEITLTVDKSRFTIPGQRAKFLFHGAYSFFEDAPADRQQAADFKPITKTEQETIDRLFHG